MFAPCMNEILFHLQPARPGALLDMRAWGELDAQTKGEIQRAAEKALNRPLPALLPSDFLERRQLFLRAREERRDMLMCLLLGACADDANRYLEKLLDLAWAICEESAWRAPRALEDCAREEADEKTLQTASLLAWTYQLAGERLPGAARERIATELSRRVLSPLAAREAPAWARLRDGRALSRLAAALAVCVLADADDRRRWLCARRCLLQMDALFAEIPADGAHPGGLEAFEADAEALSDAATLVLMATGGEVDARDDAQFQRLCDFPASAHIAGGCFVNPDGETRPALCGETLFRIGECANQTALKRLGAALAETGGERAQTPTARVLGALMKRALRAEPAMFPLRNRAFLKTAMRLMARENGFCACLSGGALQNPAAGDAGEIYLFYEDRPVFMPVGAQTRAHSLPSVSGFSPARGFGGAKDAEARFEDAFTYLSMNLAPGFPESAGVVSWQRTLMLSPMEKCVRVIEAYDLASPAGEVRFHFTTPLRPRPDGANAYIIGDARLSWETDMESGVEAVSGGYRVFARAPAGARRGNYAFVVSPA